MSELRANTISDAAGTGPATLTGQSAAKAWANFRGNSTVIIRESFSVSSVSDNGTGDYTLNFSTSFVDADYVATIGVRRAAGSSDINANLGGHNSVDPATSSIRLICRFTNTPGGSVDPSHGWVSFFR